MQKRIFEFKERGERILPLTIAGHEFKVDVAPGASRRIINLGKEMEDYSQGMYKGDDPVKATEADEDATDFLMDKIDEFLGEGAADLIFSKREPNYMDCLDVITFVMKEISAYAAERAGEYPAPQSVPLNRAQRRHRDRA